MLHMALVKNLGLFVTATIGCKYIVHPKGKMVGYINVFFFNEERLEGLDLSSCLYTHCAHRALFGPYANCIVRCETKIINKTKRHVGDTGVYRLRLQTHTGIMLESFKSCV